MRQDRGRKMARTRERRDDRRSKPLAGRFTSFTSLTAPINQVLMQIKDEGALTFPGKLNGDPNKRSRDKYCRFHRDHGHDMADYYDLNSRSKPLSSKGSYRSSSAKREQIRLLKSKPLMGQRASQTTPRGHKDDCGRHGDHRLVQKGPERLTS